jgi:hypothetical protein
MACALRKTSRLRSARLSLIMESKRPPLSGSGDGHMARQDKYLRRDMIETIA